MRTKVLSLLLACLSAALPLGAQPGASNGAAPAGSSSTEAATNGPAANAPSSELDRPLVEKPRSAASSSSEILPLISFAAEYPLADAITNLAQQAGLNFALAPDVATNSATVTMLHQPVGIVRFENLTARQALDSLLAQKGLVLGTRPETAGTLLGTLDSKLAPVSADEADLGATTPPDKADLEMIFD